MLLTKYPNEEVYRRMNTHKPLIIEIVHRQLSFICHTEI